MFFEPEPTQFDLNFRLLGVHVRVHPWFWVMSLLLGWNTIHDGISYLLMWVVCVFVSILVHEFGHVLMGLLFGVRGNIVLYSFGGLAIGASTLPNRWKRMAVSFAGPAAGFLLLAAVWLVARAIDIQAIPPLAKLTIVFLIEINLIWGLLNLLPIWPLDGGHISRDFLDWLMPQRGVNTALGISLVLAGLLSLHSFMVARTGHSIPIFDDIPYLNSFGTMYTCLMFAVMAYNSFQTMQQEAQRRPWERHDDSW